MKRAFLVASVLTLATACGPARLDENLCPRGEEPARTTILVLDTSDALDPKHQAHFDRLVRELQDPALEGRVAPGERLVVYELPQTLTDVSPVVEVCNPGERPDDWDLRDKLTQGREVALAAWRRFDERVAPLFALESSENRASSPIIEFLGVVVPRHFPSSNIQRDKRPHVILYSDLLQHSDALSHYGSYPTAGSVPNTDGLRHLHTDLSGIEFSIYRLERQRYARWQTTEHYYWWKRLIEAFGGTVIGMEPV